MKEHFDIRWKEDKDPFYGGGINSPAGDDRCYSRLDDDAQTVNYESKKADGNNFFMTFLRDWDDSCCQEKGDYEIFHDYRECLCQQRLKHHLT